MNSADLFNEQYYERGRSTGYSWYENYHWMPERSRSEAAAFVRTMGLRNGHTVVDFGCAKGFFVRALLESGFDAYGIDVSDYALSHCDPVVRGRLFKPQISMNFDFGFSKDTLEHIGYSDIEERLAYLSSIATSWMLIVPLGENGRYRIREYEYDATHVIRENESWWIEQVLRAMNVVSIRYRISGLKDHWFPIHDRGNLFIEARRR